MGQSFHQNLVHIIFSTKNRRELIKLEWEDDLFAFMGGVVRNMEGKVLISGGTADHVHLLVSTPAKTCDADFMRNLKANSSRWVKQRGSEPHFGWQEGYGWFSIGSSMRSAVEKYIRNQKEHHKKVTFQEEFEQFLKKYKVDYDARYLWD